MNTLDEKVHRIGGPAEKRGAPADKARAFDKVNARTGARKNRSVLKAMEKAKPGQEYFALDVSEDPDYTMVLVMKGGTDSDGDYYGVNVLFYPDGKVDASTGDALSDKQWKSDKAKIIKVARKQLKTDAPMGDTDADVRAYHGAGDGDYSGYVDKKMNEGKRKGDDADAGIFTGLDRRERADTRADAKASGHGTNPITKGVKVPTEVEAAVKTWATDKKKEATQYGEVVVKFTIRQYDSDSGKLKVDLRYEDGGVSSFNFTFVDSKLKRTDEGKMTFKQFLLAEAKKVKEPGWYVCDHMDKPVSGPMQERGAKEEAAEMNAKHAEKHGKGDIDPFSAEYFSDYEIKRMNEAACKSDAKRLAGQDVEAIMKAKAEIAKARKDGDEAALAKAKKKLAALTEGFGDPGEHLTRSQKAALLKDFEGWSGGFTPDDCTAAQVREYLTHGISTKFPQEAAKKYLEYIRDNGASNAP